MCTPSTAGNPKMNRNKSIKQRKNKKIGDLPKGREVKPK